MAPYRFQFLSAGLLRAPLDFMICHALMIATFDSTILEDTEHFQIGYGAILLCRWPHNFVTGITCFASRVRLLPASGCIVSWYL